MLLSACAYAQHEVSVTTLNLNNISQKYGKVLANRSVTGEPATVDGAMQGNAIGTHAPSVLKIDLHEDAATFRAKVAVADTRIKADDKTLAVVPLVDGTKMYFTQGAEKQFVGLAGTRGRIEKGSVRFVLIGDGKKIYDSGIVREGEKPRTVDVPVNGIGMLEMKVDDAGDGASGDRALWIAPTISYREKQPCTAPATAQGNGPEMQAKTAAALRKKLDKLPLWTALTSDKTPFDWLLTPSRSKAGIYATPDHKGLVIANGMVARTLRIFPNLATTNYINRMTGESMLRAVSSEGMVAIDGQEHAIGGLAGQPELAYIKDEWIDGMQTIAGSFLLDDFEVQPLSGSLPWKSTRWALNKKNPTGMEVVFTLRGEGELHNVLLKLYMSVYDEIPVIKKRFEIVNQSGAAVNVDSFKLERLSMTEPESPVGSDPAKFMLPNIHVESDFNCNGAFTTRECDITTKWATDPEYTSQRNYLLQTRCVLEVVPPIGPDQTVADGGTFSSFCVYEMPYDSYDRERKGLFDRHMQQALAPWTSQNPIFMHLTSTDPAVVKRAVDQCADCGYEMIILSFGSGLNAEDTTEVNIAKYRQMADYARQKGIEMGCYSLLASRWISDSVDVINPATGKRGGMHFGSSPCLCSNWGYDYFNKIRTFFERTGMTCFEHDGSYPGDVCASTTHAHHKGLADSQWNQFKKITELYHWMCSKGIYLNVPDYYFLSGSTKVGIGYREVNWSLPRERQLMHTRQLNYDCTWERIPSSLWSFVPLVEYQGGGAAATLEPLSEHLYEYRTLMYQNYGAGVQACYRGPRLYDTEETRQTVKEVIGWYKKYRGILNSDIIHLRKPDARDWDGIMHVNPTLKEKALAMVFNPTDKEMVRTIELPLYYAGLTGKAMVREQEGKSVEYQLTRDYKINITATIPARGFTWFVVE